MKKIFLFLISFTILASCSVSNLSKNIVNESEFYINNGTAGNKTWNENLKFKRVAWYHELTLHFDFLMTTIAPQSGFNFWLSKSELDQMSKCSEAKIVLAYSIDTRKAPYSSLYEQLDRAGYSRFDLIEFKKNLVNHPDAELNSLKLYHVFGICKTNQNNQPISLSFPGFAEKSIN